MSVHEDVATDILLHCDRTKSREARFALERLVWKPLRKDGLIFSQSCILEKSKDVLTMQESNKFQQIDALWKCLFCHKLFREEYFLDKHLARKHSRVKHKTSSVCFGDLCGYIIPCVPLSSPPLAFVSTAALNFTDSGQAVPAEKQTLYCGDKALRRKRLIACQEKIKACVHGAEGNTRLAVRRKHVERMRRVVCERAIQIDCTAREKVWNELGSPTEVLRVDMDTSRWYMILCAIAVSIATLGFIHKWSSRGRRKMSKRKEKSSRSKCA